MNPDDIPPELVQVVGACLLLDTQAGGGLFGRPAYAEPKNEPRPPELPVNFEEEDD